MLNELQKKALNRYLNHIFTDIGSNSNSNDLDWIFLSLTDLDWLIKAIKAIHDDQVYNNIFLSQHGFDVTRKSWLDKIRSSIDNIREIFKHPCPQNRKYGTPNLYEFEKNHPFRNQPHPDGVIDGYVHTRGALKEPQGILGLTALNNQSTDPVDKPDVIQHINERIKKEFDTVLDHVVMHMMTDNFSMKLLIVSKVLTEEFIADYIKLVQRANINLFDLIAMDMQLQDYIQDTKEILSFMLKFTKADKLNENLDQALIKILNNLKQEKIKNLLKNDILSLDTIIELANKVGPQEAIEFTDLLVENTGIYKLLTTKQITSNHLLQYIQESKDQPIKQHLEKNSSTVLTQLNNWRFKSKIKEIIKKLPNLLISADKLLDLILSSLNHYKNKTKICIYGESDPKIQELYKKTNAFEQKNILRYDNFIANNLDIFLTKYDDIIENEISHTDIVILFYAKEIKENENKKKFMKLTQKYGIPVIFVAKNSYEQGSSLAKKLNAVYYFEYPHEQAKIDEIFETAITIDQLKKLMLDSKNEEPELVVTLKEENGKEEEKNNSSCALM